MEKPYTSEVPENAVAGESFTFKVTTDASAKKVAVYNENGSKVTTQIVSRVEENGKAVWTVSTKVATADTGRVLSVYVAYEDGVFADSGAKAVLDIIDRPEEIKAVSVSDTTIVKGGSLDVTVTATNSLKAFAIRNENNANMGKKLVSVIKNSDGTTTRVYTIKIESAGVYANDYVRSFTVCADNGSGEYAYSEGFDVKVVPNADEDAVVISVNVPETAVKNEYFNITVVTTAGTKGINIFNPDNGNKFGKVLVSSSENEDGTITWVYSMRIGTAMETARTIQSVWK